MKFGNSYDAKKLFQNKKIKILPYRHSNPNINSNNINNIIKFYIMSFYGKRIKLF